MPEDAPPATDDLVAVDDSPDAPVALHRFLLAPDFDAQRMAIDGYTLPAPFVGSDGLERVELFASGNLAVRLGRYGLLVEGRVEHRVEERSEVDFPTGEIGRVSQALLPGCPTMLTCPTTAELIAPGAPNDYIRPLDQIENTLQNMAASHPAITAWELDDPSVPDMPGTGDLTYGGRRLHAIQFGPAQPAIDPPATVYFVSAYHAREWVTVGVAMYLAEYLQQVLINPVSNLPLWTALQDAAVVIVPVANPDGYVRTWASPSERDRRNNDFPGCAYGVNLNRNHMYTWGEPATGTDDMCVGQSWLGPGPASEAEVKALEGLYRGELAPTSLSPAAVVNYHSYANLVVYPDGYEYEGIPATYRVEDEAAFLARPYGPPCDLTDTYNCFNPDFTMLRDLFGDTHRALGPLAERYFSDHNGGYDYHYYRDHGRSLLYGVSGDTGLHNTYHPTHPVATITPELPNACPSIGFHIECYPDFNDKIIEIGTTQVRLLEHLVDSAASLVSDDPAVAYGPTHVGTLSSGMWTREYRNSGQDGEDARPTFVKPLFTPSSTGELLAGIGGTLYDYDYGRRGAHYDLYTLADYGEDPLCLPCEIASYTPQQETTVDAGFCTVEKCIDLCKESRLPLSSGWDVTSTVDDCYWEPTASGGELVYPHHSGWMAITGTKPTHCHFTFSAKWNGTSPGFQFVVERESVSGGWEELRRYDYEAPYYPAGHFVDGRVQSYAFEADSMLGDETPSFRIRLLGGVPTELKVYDPVIYCRLGEL